MQIVNFFFPKVQRFNSLIWQKMYVQSEIIIQNSDDYLQRIQTFSYDRKGKNVYENEEKQHKLICIKQNEN